MDRSTPSSPENFKVHLSLEEFTARRKLNLDRAKQKLVNETAKAAGTLDAAASTPDNGFLQPAKTLEPELVSCYAVSDNWVVSSANMPVIPFFPFDHVSVKVRADGRLGNEDFTLRPQLYSYMHRHRILVRGCPVNPTTLEYCMWWTPSEKNFAPFSNGAYRNIGRFHSSYLQDMDVAVRKLKNAVEDLMSRTTQNLSALQFLMSKISHGIIRLRYNPYTLREMIIDVAQTQHFYHDAVAWHQYVDQEWDTKLALPHGTPNPVDSSRMGCWTKDANVAQALHFSGIPVYHVQLATGTMNEQVVKNLQPLARDIDIVTAEWSLEQGTKRSPERYSGPPSEEMHISLSASNDYDDLAKFLFDVDERSNVVPVGERGFLSVDTIPLGQRGKGSGRHKKASGTSDTKDVPAPRDKWIEITGDYVPCTLSCWSQALVAVNRDKRISPAPPKWFTGYRFPDPGMILYSRARRERNLFNWLLVRECNIHRIANDLSSATGVPTGVSNEMWRLYLGVEFTARDKSNATATSSTAAFEIKNSTPHAKKRHAAVSIFGKTPDAHNLTTVHWRNHEIKWDTFCSHDSLLVQEILWDLHQFSFQSDLLALDHYLCPNQWHVRGAERIGLIQTVFGGEEYFLVDNIPSQDRGIASEDQDERHAAYQAFSTLMQEWPASEHDVDVLQCYVAPIQYEALTATMYCSTFTRVFGRPPILPKALPTKSSIHGKYAYNRS